jgi:virulence factor Mce-like protein
MSDTVIASPAARRWIRPFLSAVLAVLVVVSVGLWWWHHERKGVSFSAIFTSSLGVYPGSGVRILGVPVGTVDSVTPQGKYVRIAMHLDPGTKASASTKAVIISPNLVSDRYVQLTGAYVSGATLRNGTVIPASDTATPVELDQLYQSLNDLTQALGPNGANADGALTKLLDTGAANLSGNGALANSTISQLAQTANTLSGSAGNIFATVDNLKSFTQMLQTNNDGVVALNNNLASVSQVLANDKQTFGEAMQQLGTALSLVQTFIQDNRDKLSINVTKLDAVAQTLAEEQASLQKTLTAAPLLLQNFINAYDSKDNVLLGRADLNELTVWANQAAGNSSSSAPVTGSTTTDNAAPPTLLTPSNVTEGGAK